MIKKTSRRSKQSSPVDASPNEKQQYEERIRKLEQQNKAYQVEIEELRQQREIDPSAPNTGAEKLKADYLQKLNVLELQVAELKKKLNSQSQFSTQRKRGDEATKQSQFEIQSLKAQKVQLQCKIKLESVQFRICKASLEKEVFQLKKERRRNDYEIQKLLASNQRLKMVLQRKTEEASMATKRLRELIESRKAISKRTAGSGAGNVNDQVQAADHELEVTTQLHELCSQYESQIEEMAEEIAKLKEETEIQRQENIRSRDEDYCLKENLDIEDLKEQINGLGCLLRQLQLQKENLNSKDKMQNLVRPLFSDGNRDKQLEKMNTPEMNRSAENEVKGNKSEGLCCSCSKRSLCKTNKCRCRSAGGSCGTSCGCTRFKCRNRELNPLAEDEQPQSNNTEYVKNASAIEIAEDEGMIASEGAKLLQSALVEKPADVRDNLRRKKKPLCDIQNSLDALDARKPGKKKNLRKPTIQLVTKDSYSKLPESINSPDEAHDNEI